jgi:hypothetical protein
MTTPLELIRLTERSRSPTLPTVAIFSLKTIFILILAGISGIVAAKIRLALQAGEPLRTQLGDLVGFFISCFFVLLCLAAIPSLLLLLANVTHLRLTLSGLNHAIKALAQWYVGMICLLFATSLWTLGSIGHFFVGCMIGGLGLKFLPRGSSSFALAKRHMLRKADDLLRDDSLAPILYLRSFADDEIITSEEYYRDYDTGKSLSLAFYTEQRPRTFEEIMCSGLSLVAPVVALERPGDLLPPLGASRKSVNNKDWKSEVELLISRCRFAVLVVGNSEGLRWEFEHLLTEYNPSKILLALPAQENWAEVWELFVRRSVGSNAATLLPVELPPDALAMAFRPDWKPVVFTGERRPGIYREIAEWLSQEADKVIWKRDAAHDRDKHTVDS